MTRPAGATKIRSACPIAEASTRTSHLSQFSKIHFIHPAPHGGQPSRPANAARALSTELSAGPAGAAQWARRAGRQAGRGGSESEVGEEGVDEGLLQQRLVRVLPVRHPQHHPAPAPRPPRRSQPFHLRHAPHARRSRAGCGARAGGFLAYS
jgi:hypothetical protein